MNNQELERIRNLPDFVSSESLKKEFNKIISETSKNVKESNNLLLLEAYFELSERQWHTYEILEPEILNKIDSIIITLWDKNSLESTESITGIVGMLGLQKTYEIILSSLSQKLKKDVKQEILETVEEFGDTVTNPYLIVQTEDKQES